MKNAAITSADKIKVRLGLSLTVAGGISCIPAPKIHFTQYTLKSANIDACAFRKLANASYMVFIVTQNLKQPTYLKNCSLFKKL